MFHPDSISPEEKYKKIGGWLLLFSVSLIVWPIINLIQVSQFYRELGFYYTEYTLYFITALIDYIIFVCLMILAFVSGLAIINYRKYGLKTAKLFLFLYFLYALIKLILSCSSGDEELIHESLLFCLSVTGHFIIWTLYLYKSERVRYFDSAAESVENL